MVTKRISNRRTEAFGEAILLWDLFFFRLFLFENVLRSLCAGLVLRRRTLEYFPFSQMAAQVKTKRMKLSKVNEPHGATILIDIYIHT